MLLVIVFQELPALVEYSILYRFEVPVAAHVIDLLVPATHFSPPFGEVKISGAVIVNEELL